MPSEKRTHVIRTQLSEFSQNEPSPFMTPVIEVKKWSMRLTRGSWGDASVPHLGYGGSYTTGGNCRNSLNCALKETESHHM